MWKKSFKAKCFVPRTDRKLQYEGLHRNQIASTTVYSVVIPDVVWEYTRGRDASHSWRPGGNLANLIFSPRHDGVVNWTLSTRVYSRVCRRYLCTTLLLLYDGNCTSISPKGIIERCFYCTINVLEVSWDFISFTPFENSNRLKNDCQSELSEFWFNRYFQFFSVHFATKIFLNTLNWHISGEKYFSIA